MANRKETPPQKSQILSASPPPKGGRGGLFFFLLGGFSWSVIFVVAAEQKIEKPDLQSPSPPRRGGQVLIFAKVVFLAFFCQNIPINLEGDLVVEERKLLVFP